MDYINKHQNVTVCGKMRGADNIAQLKESNKTENCLSEEEEDKKIQGEAPT